MLQVRNLKLFTVLNPTSAAYSFLWEPERPSGGSPGAPGQGALTCLTRQVSIGAGQRAEMAFEYAPTSPEPQVCAFVGL